MQQNLRARWIFADFKHAAACEVRRHAWVERNDRPRVRHMRGGDGTKSESRDDPRLSRLDSPRHRQSDKEGTSRHT
jgi:hypothetical protein